MCRTGPLRREDSQSTVFGQDARLGVARITFVRCICQYGLPVSGTPLAFPGSTANCSIDISIELRPGGHCTTCTYLSRQVTELCSYSIISITSRPPPPAAVNVKHVHRCSRWQKSFHIFPLLCPLAAPFLSSTHTQLFLTLPLCRVVPKRPTKSPNRYL